MSKHTAPDLGAPIERQQRTRAVPVHDWLSQQADRITDAEPEPATKKMDTRAVPVHDWLSQQADRLTDGDCPDVTVGERGAW